MSFKVGIKKLSEFYDHFFYIQEIGDNKRLQIAHYGFLVGFIFSLDAIRLSLIGSLSPQAKFGLLCPDYFQSCGEWIFLRGFPESYDYDIFIALLFLFIGFSTFFAINGKWRRSHFCLLVVFLNDVVIEFFLTGAAPIQGLLGYLVYPCFVYLFSKNKMSNLIALYVFMYILAGISKLHPSWIAGGYFSTLELGLPLAPRKIIPLLSNLVIFMELVGSWALLGTHPRLKNCAFMFFTIFHSYSLILVGFRYPLLCLPLLFSLFWKGPRYEKPLSTITKIFFVFLLIGNLRPYFYKGDVKAHMQGTSLAFSMFDANRQTRSEMRFIYRDGNVKEKFYGHTNSYTRLSPYFIWYQGSLFCKDPNLSAIEWTMDVSVNGNPFLRQIDTKNLCDLPYNWYTNNDWIHSEGPMQGYPNYNFYNPGRETARQIPIIYREPKITKSQLEMWLTAYSREIVIFYLLLSLIAGIVVLTILSRFKKIKG